MIKSTILEYFEEPRYVVVVWYELKVYISCPALKSCGYVNAICANYRIVSFPRNKRLLSGKDESLVIRNVPSGSRYKK